MKERKKNTHKTPDTFRQFEKAEQLSSTDEDKREKQPGREKPQPELASLSTVNMGRKESEQEGVSIVTRLDF